MTNTKKDSTLIVPPLLGDEHGHYRVHIVGNSGQFSAWSSEFQAHYLRTEGAGKTTTGTQLAAILGVPFVSLDRLFWQPDWKKSTQEEFVTKIRQTIDSPECARGWVIDGNYDSVGGSLIHQESTDTAWLDPPLVLYLPRLILRTFLRLFRLKEPCSPGCFEMPTEVFFSKDSIVWWCITQHWPVRRRYSELMSKVGLGIGTDVSDRKMRRIGGFGGDLRRWLGDVAAMLGKKTK